MFEHKSPLRPISCSVLMRSRLADFGWSLRKMAREIASTSSSARSRMSSMRSTVASSNATRTVSPRDAAEIRLGRPLRKRLEHARLVIPHGHELAAGNHERDGRHQKIVAVRAGGQGRRQDDGLVLFVEPPRHLEALHLLARRDVDAELRLERRLLVGRGVQQVDPNEPFEIAQRVRQRSGAGRLREQSQRSSEHLPRLRARDSSTRRATGRKEEFEAGGTADAVPPGEDYTRWRALLASSAWLCSSRICVTDRDRLARPALMNNSGIAIPRPSTVAIIAWPMP